MPPAPLRGLAPSARDYPPYVQNPGAAIDVTEHLLRVVRRKMGFTALGQAMGSGISSL